MLDINKRYGIYGLIPEGGASSEIMEKWSKPFK
jgi:hypothetical protein